MCFGTSDERVIGGGYEHDGLYYLQCDDNPSVGIVTTVSEAFPLQWHFLLGYASVKSVNKLFSSFRSLSKLKCTSCQLRKMLGLLLFQEKINVRLEVIPTNIWGPT